MTKVFKANMYFLIILLIEIFGPLLLRPFYLVLGLSDTRIILFLNHVILFLLPAVIYIIATKSSFKETLKLNKLHWQDTLLIILLAFVVQPIMTFFSLIATFFFNNEIGSFISEITSTPYVFLLALVALLPAITEEVSAASEEQSSGLQEISNEAEGLMDDAIKLEELIKKFKI